MKSFITMAYLFLASFFGTCGIFIMTGAPAPDNLPGVICLGLAFVMFERISTFCGVIK